MKAKTSCHENDGPSFFNDERQDPDKPSKPETGKSSAATQTKDKGKGKGGESKKNSVRNTSGRVGR